MISTTLLEYLKKKIDTINNVTEFSNLTTLNTLLYCKESKKKGFKDKSSYVEAVDNCNMFLARINI
jgi:hypothetical protein